jgi:hypothetical protein
MLSILGRGYAPKLRLPILYNSCDSPPRMCSFCGCIFSNVFPMDRISRRQEKVVMTPFSRLLELNTIITGACTRDTEFRDKYLPLSDHRCRLRQSVRYVFILRGLIISNRFVFDYMVVNAGMSKIS